MSLILPFISSPTSSPAEIPSIGKEHAGFWRSQDPQASETCKQKLNSKGLRLKQVLFMRHHHHYHRSSSSPPPSLSSFIVNIIIKQHFGFPAGTAPLRQLMSSKIPPPPSTHLHHRDGKMCKLSKHIIAIFWGWC